MLEFISKQYKDIILNLEITILSCNDIFSFMETFHVEHDRIAPVNSFEVNFIDVLKESVNKKAISKMAI